MNSSNDSQNLEEILDDFNMKDSTSLDDFIKELEAKEKDLHISSEMVIEIEDSDFDDKNIPDFVQSEVSTPKTPLIQASGANELSVNKQALAELEKKILKLQETISNIENEKVEMFETMRRRQADFDNYKKRTERDRGETFLNQISNLVVQMLPVLDNLNRAIDSADHIPETKSREFQHFFDGIVLVNQQLNEVLAEMGVSPIGSVGEYFDPYFHEAVATGEGKGFPPNTIIEELLRGYRIGDKIVRPSMVKVASAAKSTLPDVSEETDDNVILDISGAE